MAFENNEQKTEFRPSERFSRNRRRYEQERDEGIVSKTVSVNRVTKVVKGGRNMRFPRLSLWATRTAEWAPL